jgi:hypothetical protein
MIALAAAVLALAASHYDDPAAGIHALLPAGWHAAPRLTALAGPRELVTLASYPLHAGGGCGPQRALHELPPHGALVFVLEYVPPPRRGFPPRPAHVHLRARDRAVYECIGRPGWLLRFRDAGRALQIHVVLGSRAGARMRRRVERVVQHLRFDRQRYRTLPPPTAEMDNETGDSLHVPSGLSSDGYRFSAWIAAGPRAPAPDVARAERAPPPKLRFLR